MGLMPGISGRSWIRTLYDFLRIHHEKLSMTAISKIMTPIAGTVKYPIKYCCLLLCILLLSSFELWGHFYPSPAHNWNIAKVHEISVGDPSNFSFAVFGDNRGSKFVFENLLKMIDHDRDITFAINLGDFVRNGKKEKYDYFLNQVRRYLNIPLLTTMGNHELGGKGRKLHHAIFGPSFYSFQIGKHYFIVLDNADKKGLDPKQKQWIEKELEMAMSYNSRIIFMHVPLYDPRGGRHHHCLPKESSEMLITLFMKYSVTHIFASHIHGYFEGDWKGIPYTISGGAGAKLAGDDPDHYFFHFLKAHITNGNLDIQVKHVLPSDYKCLSIFSCKTWYRLFCIYTFFRTYGELTLLLIAGGLTAVIYRSESRSVKISPN